MISFSLDSIAIDPKVVDAFERARDRIDLTAFFGEPMNIEVEAEVVIKLADANALLAAAKPFVGSIQNAATRALGEALKPLEAAVNPLLEAIETARLADAAGLLSPTEPTE